jgi:hypothetical protein
MHQLLIFILLAALALAKQVPSPLGSLDVTRASDGGKKGTTNDVWNMNFSFSLKPFADNIQPGDYFKFTVDDKLSFGLNNFNFDVKDADGNVILKITNNGPVFTGTYTDYVATKNDAISGAVDIQTLFDANKIKTTGPTTVTVTPQVGGPTLKDTVTLLGTTNPDNALKWGELNGCCLVLWHLRLPTSPYNRAEITDTRSDGNTEFFDQGTLMANTRLIFRYNLNDMGGFSKQEWVLGSNVAKYLTYTSVTPKQFTARLENIPDNVSVEIQYFSRITNQASLYKNSYSYVLYDKPPGGTGGNEWTRRGNGGGYATNQQPGSNIPSLNGGGSGSGSERCEYERRREMDF